MLGAQGGEQVVEARLRRTAPYPTSIRRREARGELGCGRADGVGRNPGPRSPAAASTTTSSSAQGRSQGVDEPRAQQRESAAGPGPERRVTRAHDAGRGRAAMSTCDVVAGRQQQRHDQVVTVVDDVVEVGRVDVDVGLAHRRPPAAPRPRPRPGRTIRAAPTLDRVPWEQSTRAVIGPHRVEGVAALDHGPDARPVRRSRRAAGRLRPAAACGSADSPGSTSQQLLAGDDLARRGDRAGAGRRSPDGESGSTRGRGSRRGRARAAPHPGSARRPGHRAP